VTAAAEAGDPAGHLPSLVAMIRPAVERARRQSGDLIENAVRLNVENVVSEIKTSKPLLADVIARGELKVVGAVYSLESGKVAWLPDQSSASPPSAGDVCPR
jgi:carbonic anhydrase